MGLPGRLSAGALKDETAEEQPSLLG